ncbi:ABC transporter permease [Dactylosporangium sp. AC04546]|uniref:ABC transporter permease n=1 Tax=Dactylosporangium sp. AC04546 TaxID=2862460 RepID=UPI001EDD578C|nr:ABC transporter permease [Dactylosporangium sp. AC04546]WVK82497.1 ABC transporter permease [Dactylosporangium sp. AC04546]
MATLAALEYHLVSYRRTWRSSVFSSFALPAMFLVAMGVTVGHYVDARSTAIGVPYLDYIGPGLLASTALQVAIGESTWPVFSAFNWIRTYHAMRASPLTSGAIVRGHLLYILLRVLLATAGFLLVLLPFGALHSWWALATPLPALLVGLACAAPCFAFAAAVDNDGFFAVLFRLAVVPMTLFSGVFFPVEDLPAPARLLAYVSPLWHGVELCRAATLGTPTAWGVPLHTAVLLLWSAAGYVLALRYFTRKLED